LNINRAIGAKTPATMRTAKVISLEVIFGIGITLGSFAIATQNN